MDSPLALTANRATTPAAPAPRTDLRDRVLVVALALAIGAFARWAPLNDVLGWTSAAIGTAVIGTIAWRRPAVRGALLVAFALRLGAVLVHQYAFDLPGSEADARIFEREAWDWGRNGLRAAMDHFVGGAYLYSWIIALFYGALGRSPFLAQVLNVVFGTLVVLNVFTLTRMLADERTARRAAWITAVFPTLVLYSALTMREIAVTYPFSLAAIFLARWRLTNRPIFVVVGLAALFVSITFHPGMFGVIVGGMLYIVFTFARAVGRGDLRASVRTGIALGAMVAGGAVAAASGIGNVDYATRLSLREARLQQEVAAVDRAAYLQGLTTNSPADLVWQAPIRTFFFLYTPFPWWIGAAQDLLGILDAMLYVWLSWCVLRALPAIRRHAAAGMLLLLSLTAVLFFAMAVSNYGTAIRHRAKVAPVLIAIALAAPILRRERQRLARERAPRPRPALQPG